MPFVVPAMPLLMSRWNAWDPTTSLYATPDAVDVPCCISPGKRSMVSIRGDTDASLSDFAMEVLLPALEKGCAGVHFPPRAADVLEIPQGSTRFYMVRYVDDIGKGFANEHRFFLVKMIRDDMVFADVTLAFPVTLP